MELDDRPILQRSVNTERALTLPRPRLRGVSHLIAAILMPPLAIIAIVAAPGTRERLGVAAFGVGMTVMFGLSALLHARRWDARTYERLFRLDHSGIYAAIGGTGIAMALLGLSGWPAQVLLIGSVVGITIGVLVEWLPFAPPRGFNSAVYLTLGWIPIALLPWLWTGAGPVTVVLLLVGGVLYTAGAIIVGTRRPDPSPAWFGYHEIFHLLVIAAVIVHAVMLLRLVPWSS
ncbi:MAG: hemolysin III family protein [Nitriliruptoraceae bacterium]|nr:hemolysin III family protein [Nitriliruptoraceae bacterium]